MCWTSVSASLPAKSNGIISLSGHCVGHQSVTASDRSLAAWDRQRIRLIELRRRSEHRHGDEAHGH